MFVTDTPMLRAIRDGSIVFDPSTGVTVPTEDAEPALVAAAEAAVKRFLTEGYSGPFPREWVALESHYRSIYPLVWPPADHDGREYRVETMFAATPGGPWVADGIVIVGEDGDDTPVLIHIDDEAAERLAHLILYHLAYPQPVPDNLKPVPKGWPGVVEVAFGTGSDEVAQD